MIASAYPPGRYRMYPARVRLLILALVLLVLAAGPVPALASNPFVGNVAFIEAGAPPELQAYVTRFGTHRETAVAAGDALFQGDILRTGPDMRMQVALADGSHVYIGPASRIEFKNCAVDAPAGRRRSLLRALAGTLRFHITKLFRNKATGNESQWRDSEVTVESQTAIMGVRGTDFTVSINQNAVDIAVLEGVVGVRGTGADRSELLLTANRITRVGSGMAPSGALVLGVPERARLLHDTTPGKLLKMPAVPAGAGSGKSRPNVERDLAAGIPLKYVIDQAVQDGFSIHEVVAEAIASGVDPAAVVYAAVSEGYTVTSVVTAALKSGADLNTVVSAAALAGADKKSIYAGAAAAGAPPAAVADAIASTGVPGAPVFGSPTPVETSPVVYVPPAPVVVSGGGGATPSTLPASPYKP